MKGFLWFWSAVFFLFGCGSIDYLLKNPDYVFLPAGMTAVSLVLCVYFGYKAKTYSGQAIDRHHKLELKEYSEDEAQLIETSWQKAVGDYARVDAARRTIRDGELREQLAVMQQVAANLLDYLEKHQKAIPAARRFIDTYQDRAARLAEEYRELEKTGLDTEQVAETRENIKDTLASFDEAYEKEFERVLSDKLLDMDAELSVLQKTMAADGIENLPSHEEKKTAASVQENEMEKTTVLADVRRFFDKQEPVVHKGTGLQNRGGRKHPRRRQHVPRHDAGGTARQRPQGQAHHERARHLRRLHRRPQVLSGQDEVGYPLPALLVDGHPRHRRLLRGHALPLHVDG